MKTAYTIKSTSDGVIGVYTTQKAVIEKVGQLLQYDDCQLTLSQEKEIRRGYCYIDTDENSPHAVCYTVEQHICNS